MFDWLRRRLLHFLRVPPEPTPPAGAPESIRVFRAGRNYYRLRLFAWLVTQATAVIGIFFSVGFLYWFKAQVKTAHEVRPPPAITAPADAGTAPGTVARPRARLRRQNEINRGDIRALAQRTPMWGVVVIEVVELGGILLFLLQLPITFASVRLEFELHWYIVTDRSLRIRTGLFQLKESTMSFANLQQVEVKQGPLQRMLGLADVRVQSAGGGGGEQPGKHAQGDSLHTGVFHGVDNASDIRDLILMRLRTFRESGLGDPDDHGQHHEPKIPISAPVPSGDALAAAREVLTETRALRRALG